MGKTKEWKRSVTWKCLECEGNPEFEHPDMMKHMREVHGFDPKTTQATRTGLAFLDGAGFYQNTYEYEVNGMKFIKCDFGERA